MIILQEEMPMNEEMPVKKKSMLREEIESLLREKGITLEKRITVMSLDTGESYYFNDYPEALQFLKEKKGRWYLTTPGIRREDDRQIYSRFLDLSRQPALVKNATFCVCRSNIVQCNLRSPQD